MCSVVSSVCSSFVLSRNTLGCFGLNGDDPEHRLMFHVRSVAEANTEVWLGPSGQMLIILVTNSERKPRVEIPNESENSQTFLFPRRTFRIVQISIRQNRITIARADSSGGCRTWQMGGPGLSRGGPESMGVPKSRLGFPITLSLSALRRLLRLT